MKFSLFSAILFSIGWMSVVAEGGGRPVDCCLSVTDTKPPFENIVKYEMQDPALCGIRAVRFYTKKNKVVCSDPESIYAKRAMNIVDGRMTTTPTICSTTNTIPAVTTTNKTPGKKTETSTSTTATRIVTRIETSSPETVITKTTNQELPMSKENPKFSFSTATCGTDGPGTVTHLTTTDNTETTSPKRTKPSKLKIKLRKNKNKKLRRFQMNIHHKDKSG